MINPVSGENADRPYSPKQTCGRCHDYDTITRGYHFTQGQGEEPTADQRARCLWASTPGNYGGTWCSPAPLYPYLSPKKNDSPATMDMTSFKFFTMPCGTCHPGGGSATDPRISGREEHQIGKGDDPGGHVRDELDNTMVACADCHATGRLGAPIATHRWLPPLHMEKIACQTCHIPERLVMPIEVQASDVFNPAPYISGGKKLWTFYGPDWKFRNHYGYLTMMGYDDKPTERFRPALVRYKGKIYPANRVHSAWLAIEIEGQPGLMQPRASDVLKMWTAHREDSSKYPTLAQIADDNGDGVIEVNRPEEIDALIAAVSQMLADTNYPMAGKRVVWVMDDRVYASGTEFRT